VDFLSHVWTCGTTVVNSSAADAKICICVKRFLFLFRLSCFFSLFFIFLLNSYYIYLNLTTGRTVISAGHVTLSRPWYRYRVIQKSLSTHTRALGVCVPCLMYHLGRFCAQTLLNHFPLPTLAVLTGAQGLLNHPVQIWRIYSFSLIIVWSRLNSRNQDF
jgi:hypothetical protein